MRAVEILSYVISSGYHCVWKLIATLQVCFKAFFFIPPTDVSSSMVEELQRRIKAIPPKQCGLNQNCFDALIELAKLIDQMEGKTPTGSLEEIHALFKQKLTTFTDSLNLESVTLEEIKILFDFNEQIKNPCRQEFKKAIAEKLCARLIDNPLTSLEQFILVSFRAVDSSLVDPPELVPLGSSSRLREIPEMIKAMVVFRNYNPKLAPRGALFPKMSAFIEIWKDFIGSNRIFDEMMFYLKLLEDEFSFNAFKATDFESQWRIFNTDEVHYIPFCFKTKEGMTYQSIAEVTSTTPFYFKPEDGTVYQNAIEAVIAARASEKRVYTFRDVASEEEKTFQNFEQRDLRAILQENYDFIKQQEISDSSRFSSPFYQKPMKVFLKDFGKEQQLGIKTAYKIKLLQEIVSFVPKWPEDEVILPWVEGSIANLEKAIDKLLKKNPDDQKAQEYLHFCSKLTEQINDIRKKPLRRIVPEFLDIEESNLQTNLVFGETSPIPAQIQIDQGPQTVEEVEEIVLPKRFPNFTIQKGSQEDYFAQAQVLQEWVDSAQKAFDKRDFRALARISQAYLACLPTAEEATPFFIGMKKSEEDKELRTLFNYESYIHRHSFGRNEGEKPYRPYVYNENPLNLWALPSHRMTYFLIHTQMIKLQASPEALKEILKGLAFQLRLSDIATMKDHHATSPLSTYPLAPFLKGFQNYAANFGEYGGEVLEILKLMRKPYRLDKHISHPEDHSCPIYTCEDQIAAHTAYELLCFLDLLCNKISLALSMSDENSDSGFREKNNKALEKYFKGIEQLKQGELLRLGYKISEGYSRDSYWVFPFENLYRKEFDQRSSFFQKNVGSAISSFKHLSPPIRNPKIRGFIQQALLTTKTELAETGFGAPLNEFRSYQNSRAIEEVEDAKSFHNVFLGENKTQKTVYQEKESIPGISSSCFQDLQLMQTSSLSRASNTLLTFEKHPELLSHPEYGDDFQTIFALNFFRDAAVYREFVHHPKEIEKHFQSIDQLINCHFGDKHYETVLFLIDTRHKMILLLQSTLQQNKWDADLISKLQQSQTKWTSQIRGWWKAVQQGKADADLIDAKEAICLSLLVSEAKAQIVFKTDEQIKALMEICVVFANSKRREKISVATDDLIDRYLLSYRPKFVQLINEKGPAALLESILPDSNKKKWTTANLTTWTSPDGLCFKADTLTLQIIGQVRKRLPLFVQNHSILNTLDTTGQLQKTQTLSPVKWKNENGEIGWAFDLEKDAIKYQIIFNYKREEVLIYRTQGEQSDQFISMDAGAETEFSQALKNAFCWKNIRTGEVRIENSKGKEIYRCKDHQILHVDEKGIEGKVLSLDRLGERREMLSKFAGEGNLELIQNQWGQIVVTFSEFNFSYQWNEKMRVWESLSFKGYNLSGLSLSEVVKRTSREEGIKALFPLSFGSYHLLQKENAPHAPKKLILAPIQYERKLQGRYDKLIKYQWQASPVVNGNAWGSFNSVCVFNIDLEGNLSAQHSTNYLYLSYVLFTQRQYTDAMTYLRRGQIVADYDPGLWRTFRHWVAAWNDLSSEAAAFKMHVSLAEQNTRKWRIEDMEETITNDEALPELMESYAAYKEKEASVPSLFRLTKSDVDHLEMLEARALQRNEEGVIIAPETWGILSERTQRLVGRQEPPQKIVEHLLEEQLRACEAMPPQEKEAPSIEEPVDGSIESISLDAYVVPQERLEKVAGILKELKEVFNEENYVDEIGKELIADIDYYSQTEQTQFKKEANLNELKAQYQRLWDKWKAQEALAEGALIATLHLPKLHGVEERIRHLENSAVTFQEILSQVKICYGNQEYQPLVDKGLLHESDKEYIDGLIDRYLECKLSHQNWRRKVQAIELYQKKEIHEAKCLEIILSHPVYYGKTSSVKRIFKVIEVELNLSIKDMQLSALIQEVTHPNAFKHAGTGFGKTFLQRHLLLQLKNLKGQLGGQLTLEDLFKTHHRGLASAQRDSFGTTVFPFCFTRQDSLVPYRLWQIQLRIHRARKEKALLDHRKSDVLSLKSKFADAFLGRAPFELFEEFQKIRNLHKKYLSVNTDEFMAVADPSRDHNFSYGPCENVEKTFYDVCLDLFVILKSDKTLAPFFQHLHDNKLKLFTEQQFSDWLDQVARVVIQAEGYSGEDAVCIFEYLRQKYLGKSTEAISKKIETLSPEKEARIYCFHRYFEIFKDFRPKLIGVHFGRSKDGLTTKPFRKSAYCLENSQRSDITTTIFETCFDYIARGVSVQHVKVFVAKKQELARKEAKEVQKNSIAQNFRASYGLDLFDALKAPAELLSKINSSGEGIKDFLNTIYFKNLTYYSKKIEGTNCHLPNQYKELSGSSGSAERVETLPYAIKRNPDLVRQKGDVGGKFYHLMVNLTPEHWIKIDPQMPIPPQIGPHLDKGNVFIDVAPFCPGATAKEIAASMVQHTKDPQQNVRYVNEEGQLRTLFPGEPNSEMIGVLSQLHTEGTDWAFRDGIISLSENVPFTDFYQAMRMRELGLGRQEAFIAYDVDWEAVEKKYPKLKGKSRLVQMVYLLINNEVESLKKLHYTRLLKEIRAIAYNAVDNMLLKVKSEEAYYALRLIPEIERIFAPTHPVTISELGAFRTQKSPDFKLKAIAEEESRLLQKISAQVEGLNIDDTDLKKAMEQLKDVDQILLPLTKLPNEITSFDDSIEDLEIEQSIQVEVVELSQEEELVTEVDISQQVDEEQAEVFYPRGVSDVGREIVISPFEDAINALLNAPSVSHPNAFRLKNVVHSFFITAHALGYPSGKGIEQSPNTHFWFEKGKERLVMGPKIAFLKVENKRAAVFMSVKDADLFLQPNMLKRNLLKPGETYEYGYIYDPTGKTSKALDPAPQWEEDKKIDLTEWDIREQQFPPNADEFVKEAIVYAKLLFLDCDFGEEDLALAKKILQKDNLESLKDRLLEFLKKHYPEKIKSHPLLKIFSGV